MIFAIVLGATAAIISAVAGYFSITGLAMIFPAAKWSVIIMGVALELGKLVSASWVYRFWDTASKILRSYFIVAVIILSGITSLGIFGFLSRAHLEGQGESQLLATQKKSLEASIQREIQKQEQYQVRLRDLNQITTEAMKSNSGIRRVGQIRQSQVRERNTLDSLMNVSSMRVDSLNTTKSNIDIQQKTKTAETGPLAFLAEVLYDNSKQEDKAVQLLILIIMVVFDPLAILLVVATNIQLSRLRNVEVSDVDTSFDSDSWFTMVTDPTKNRHEETP